jgi:hypothetical protein
MGFYLGRGNGLDAESTGPSGINIGGKNFGQNGKNYLA